MRLSGKGNSNFHGARPVHENHLDDSVDSDQKVVNEDLSLSLGQVLDVEGNPLIFPFNVLQKRGFKVHGTQTSKSTIQLPNE